MPPVAKTRLQRTPRRWTPAGWTGQTVPGGEYRGGGTESITFLRPPPNLPNRLPPVVFCHGFGGVGRDVVLSDIGLGRTAQAFADAGHCVIGADLGGASTWGNPDSQDAIDDAIAYAGFIIPTMRTDRVAFWCESMGATVGLQWAAHNMARVAWAYASVPCVGLAALRANPVGELFFGASIDTAFGGNAAYLAALPNVDPSAPAQTDALRALGPRLRIDAAPEDIFMLPTMYEAFLDECPDTDFRWTVGGHDSARYIDFNELSRWSRALSLAAG